jgi:hypothetical protein
MKYVPELATFATKTCLLQASPAEVPGIDTVDGKIRAENLAEMAVHALSRQYDFGGMIAFFIK